MPENSKKNKRGARGSVEDDVNEAKRQVKTFEDMADNDNQEKSEVAPTLSDLRGMLVVLQCSVNNILSDNQKLHEEMSALKLLVDTQGREFQKMKESVERITKENESLKNSYVPKENSMNRRKKWNLSGLNWRGLSEQS